MSSLAFKRDGLGILSGEKVGKLARWFIVSAGGILLVTGTAKVVSALGRAEILNVADPIFGVSFRFMMLTAGILELTLSAICFFGKGIRLQAGLVAWLSTSFLLYRIGLWFVGWKRPCGCLGRLTDILHLSPQTADSLMKIVLAYLFVASWIVLGGFHRRTRNTFSSVKPEQK